MLWLLALIPAISGAVLYAARLRSRPALAAAACGALALTLLLAIAAAAGSWTGRLEWSDALVLTVDLTPVAAAMAMLVPAIAFPILLYASAHEREHGITRLLALLLIFVGGMELVVIAADLLTLLIGWEIVGACSWALISHEWSNEENPASGLYAFIMTRFGDLGMFLAAIAAYSGAGSFAYSELGGLAGPHLHLVVFGLLISAAAKSGQVPFAPWLFRAMAGPTSVSALLHAAAMVAAGAYLLVRLHPVLEQATAFAATAIAIGLVTALAGGTVAVLQAHAKKLLAASTSAHYGLMFVAAGAGYPGAAFLHLIAHAAFKALMFLSAGIAGERAGSYVLRRMGFLTALPLTATLSAVGTLALAGVPPLGGGWTKEAVVAAAEHESVWIAAGVMLAGALSAAYAVRFQLLAYGAADDPPEGQNPGSMERAGLVMLAAVTLLLSVFWVPAVHEHLAALLDVDIPSSTIGALVASLLFVGAGLLAGVYLSRRAPALGTEGSAARAAEWLGVPTLFALFISRPFGTLASAAVWADDHVLDAGPRVVAGAGSKLADALALGDRRLVDRGVEATASFAAWLARIGDRFGELLTDGLPEGTARLVGFSGADARSLQTGMSHHYYALLGGGAVITIIIMILIS